MLVPSSDPESKRPDYFEYDNVLIKKPCCSLML